MTLLCLLLAALPEGPYVRWIDQKGDVHVEEVRAILAESPSEVRVRMPDGSERTMPMARMIDLVRESRERPEERALIDARRDVAAGVRVEAARTTLDRLARDGSEPWIREYAAANRALLAEQTGEADAADRLARFVEENPGSRFVCNCVLAQARIRASAVADRMDKVIAEMESGHKRVVELDCQLTLRFRLLRDTIGQLSRDERMLTDPMFSAIIQRLGDESGVGGDYGATVLLEAETKWTRLLLQCRAADVEVSKGRPPRGALHDMKKLRDTADLDLPEVRSDIERELGRLMLECGDKEGARGAWERARDLAPDPRRREAAEDALKKLGDGK